jgi:riboflavin biosynthesis pyrimidine reductase
VDTHPLVRASLAVSLDGYIADKNDGVGWLNPSSSNCGTSARETSA